MANAETPNAQILRIATWNADLSRKGPGLLLADIQKGQDPQIAAAVKVIIALDADVLLLTAFDFDQNLIALTAFADLLAKSQSPYPYKFALRPNSGVQTGLDLDGNGYLNDARDAQGYGTFAGEAGIALLSRRPIDVARATDYSAFLWRDLPGALIPAETPSAIQAIQRLATTNHWQVPIALPNGENLGLMAFYATPPVFDGPEDRNGRRNHDESAFWARLLEGQLPFEQPTPPFVLLGDANLDPKDGDGLRDGISALLSHPALQDPNPRGTYPHQDPSHRGDPALDTADYSAIDGLGGLRVDYVLPSADLQVVASGVFWPEDNKDVTSALNTASRHRPVWVDIALP